MNKFLFWISVRILGFISLPISVGLLVLHYLSKTLQDLSAFSSIEVNQDLKFNRTQIKYFARDTLEESR
jgi:hypothetical protein